MAMYVTFKDGTEETCYVGREVHFSPHLIPFKLVEMVQLDGDELAHACNSLGALRMAKKVVRYFGDEANRIYYNW